MTAGVWIAVAALSIATAVAIVPAAVLLAQVAAARRWASRRTPEAAPPAPPDTRMAVIMPAHDEAESVAVAIAAIRSQLGSPDRLLVVADNCADATADVARAAGATVVERHDPVRQGKGYALDHGVRALAADPPDVVVIVDADCIVASGGLRRLRDRAAATGRPCQAHYRMLPPPDPTVKQRISAFAWVVRNTVRPLGWHRMGLPCQLMGTGMAFPWALLRDASLASGHLVEDLELGIALAQAGRPPLFCPEAEVTSTFPADDRAATAQRTRWEHGHIAILLGGAPRLAAAGVLRGDASLLAMALDLAVPPLASLVLATVLLLLLGAGAGLAGISWWPAGLAAIALVLIGSAIVLAWRRFGRATVSAADLASAPFYVLRKVPIYLRLIWNRQVTWVRTKR